MLEEKDMIEINLNAGSPPSSSSPPLEGKATNYFGNIRFARANRGFPYGLQEDEADRDEGGCGRGVGSGRGDVGGGCDVVRRAKGPTPRRFDYASFVDVDVDRPSKRISCLRQMYCPECHQRLDDESVRFERLLHCCLPFFPLACGRRASEGRKVFCNKCGSSLGFWKRS